MLCGITIKKNTICSNLYKFKINDIYIYIKFFKKKSRLSIFKLKKKKQIILKNQLKKMEIIQKLK